MLFIAVLGAALVVPLVTNRLNVWWSSWVNNACAGAIVGWALANRFSIALVGAVVGLAMHHLWFLFRRYPPLEDCGDLEVTVARWTDRRTIDQMFTNKESMLANGWTEAASEEFRRDLGFVRFPVARRSWLIGRAEGHIVALVGVHDSPVTIGEEGDLSMSVTVHPDHREHGYREAMNTALLRMARSFDVDVWVGTSPETESVRALYEGLGYVGKRADLLTPDGTTFEGLWYLVHPGRTEGGDPIIP